MRAGSKRWAIVAGIAAILVAVLLAMSHRPSAGPGAVKITFLGYTNAPNNSSLFAVFSVSNLTGHGIRWWGDWVEIEGESSRTANVVNPALPGYNVYPGLRAGASVTLAVGDPFHAPETGRWRYTMEFHRYSLGMRWFDFAVLHRLPLKLGPITLVDPLRGLNLEESVVVSSDWLTD